MRYRIFHILGIVILLSGCTSTIEKRVKKELEAQPVLEDFEVNEVKKYPLQINSKVIFVYEDPQAGSVYVAGDFNNWNKDSTSMIKDETGVFKVEVTIAPGTYHYKYVVDGDWITDPANPDTTPDGYGGWNSVITVE